MKHQALFSSKDKSKQIKVSSAAIYVWCFKGRFEKQQCLMQSSRSERVLRIIQRQFFLFLNKNICCDPSLEPSQQDGHNEGHNICF